MLAAPVPAARRWSPLPAAPRRPPRSRLGAAAATETPPAPSREQLYASLEAAIEGVRQLPPSQRRAGGEEAAAGVRSALSGLRSLGAFSLFGCAPPPQRRTIAQYELRSAGIKEPEAIGRPSIRNDAAFLGTVVLSSSAVAVALGVFLPGDWGAFGAYLAGGTSLAVLAVGSTAPGLLEIPIAAFSNFFPDYRERVVAHEAAHFLVAHLLGIPVLSYSLDLGKEHTDLLEAGLQRKIVGYERLSASELDSLAVLAMSGVAAEAMRFPEVVGQNTDLLDLQRLLNRSASPLSGGEQQNLTRWAVWQAAALLRAHAPAFDRLREALAQRKGTVECIRALEGAA